jgi:protein arginine N-methyltransferase 1
MAWFRGVGLARFRRYRPSRDFGNLYIHERMLADEVRMRAYREAIAAQIRPGDVVVDLGTGTGILAILAERRGARVYAIDHSPFIDVAREVAARNGARNIVFVEVNSRAFTPPEPVDVILHEQIGDDLFEEDMVANLLDLKRRTLKDTGRILPGAFELFLEPVQLKEEFRVPHIWEPRHDGIDFSFLADRRELDRYRHPGYPYSILGGWAVDRLLCDPEPALRFDLNRMRDPGELQRAVRATRTVTRAGRMDGLLLYFTVIFDETTRFETSPVQTRTHWTNRLFRTPARAYAAGDTVRYRLSLDELTSARRWELTLV